MIVHIDCNNFFVSCERIFRPDLQKKAVVVLSNNDGCAIARSEEAKALGIAMCEPYFQFRKWEHMGALIVFSANFSLYADISTRIMRRLSLEGELLEQYSIDECFLFVDGDDLIPFATYLRSMLWRELSIPVSIGIGRTKTEAKMATYLAKKEKSFHGVCSLVHLLEEAKEKYFKNMSLSAVWGINKKTEEKLRKRGVFSVFDLVNTSHSLLRQWEGVFLERIGLELTGTPCYGIQEERSASKSLIHSRSFSEPIYGLQEMKEVVASFACRAAERLRRQKQSAHMITLSIFEKERGVESFSLPLAMSTSCSIEISKKALACLSHLYKERSLYIKVSVLLSGLTKEEATMASLWEPSSDIEKRKARMDILDDISSKYGKKALFLGSEGLYKEAFVSLKRSPSYTTSWDDLPLV